MMPSGLWPFLLVETIGRVISQWWMMTKFGCVFCPHHRLGRSQDELRTGISYPTVRNCVGGRAEVPEQFVLMASIWPSRRPFAKKQEQQFPKLGSPITLKVVRGHPSLRSVWIIHASNRSAQFPCVTVLFVLLRRLSKGQQGGRGNSEDALVRTREEGVKMCMNAAHVLVPGCIPPLGGYPSL